MTTGSITTGICSFTTKSHRAKTWAGTDGRYTADVPPQQKWNDYSVCAMRFASANPNKLGVVYKPTGQYTEVNNHSWASLYNPTATGHVSGIPFPTSLFNQYWGANEELALLSKLINEVRGHSFDMGVALAEVDKFAGTVVGTLKNLAYGVEDLSKLRFDRFARRFGARPPSRKTVRELTARDVSGRFLEMRYAWLPAIHDVYEASKAFEELSNGPRKVRFKASIRRKLEEVRATNWLLVPVQIEVRRKYLVEMREELDWNASLGLSHPGNVLWERLPYSFVIDWFIPIGTYLSVLGVIPRMKANWCRTSSIRMSANGSGFPLNVSTHYATTPQPTCNLEVFRMQRTPSVSPPAIPSPTLKVNGAVQGRRVWNAVALAHQVFSKYI